MPVSHICPLDHRSNLIVRDGVLVLHGEERARYRCDVPDGSFHHFVGALRAEEAEWESSPEAGPWDGTSRIEGLPTARSSRRAPLLARSAGIHDHADETVGFAALSPWPTPGSHLEGADDRPSLIRKAVRRHADPAAPLVADVRPERIQRSGARVLVLPGPPTDEEKYWYLDSQGRVFMYASAVAALLVIASLTYFALSNPITWVFLGLVLLRVATSAVAFSTSSRRRRVDRSAHERRVTAWGGQSVPSVDVFLPSAGEDLDILNNTYFHVSRLTWPSQLKIHVLDDSARPEVEELALAYGFQYHCRPDRGRMKKAGNLKYGFEHSAGDLIAIFDADFVPRPDYLFELVPYFDDPDVGIVQSPQFFDTHRGMNWLQRAAGSTQELFYRCVQPARDAARAAICVGTCALYRRSALNESGGFAQIGHSEDVHTGVNLLKVGYFVRYVPIVVSKGLCPDNMAGFLSQQYRWCAGSMSLLVDRKFHAAPLSFKQRMCFFSGFLYYISTAVFVVTELWPTLIMLWFFPQQIFVENYRLLLPAIAMSFSFTPLMMRCTWRRAEVMRVQMLYSFAHALAIFHTLRGRTADWVPTGAAGKSTPLAVKIRRLMLTTTVVGQVLLWVGIVRVLPDIGMARMWPMVLLAALLTCMQVPVFCPLRASRPEGAIHSPPYPIRRASAPSRVAAPVPPLMRATPLAGPALQHVG